MRDISLRDRGRQAHQGVRCNSLRRLFLNAREIGQSSSHWLTTDGVRLHIDVLLDSYPQKKTSIMSERRSVRIADRELYQDTGPRHSKKQYFPFLELPQELRNMIYRSCHPCLANKEFHLNAVTARCGPPNVRRLCKDPAWILKRYFREPEITISGGDVFGDPNRIRLPTLMIMMNKQVYGEMRSLLQRPRYIVNVNDYYIYRTWSSPTLTVEEGGSVHNPIAESLVVNFIYTNASFSVALAEAAKAANVEGNSVVAQDDGSDGSSYFNSPPARYGEINTRDFPPVIPESEIFEQLYKQDAFRAQESRELNLANIVTRCMHGLLGALAFKKITHLEVNLPMFTADETQSQLLKDILNIVNDECPYAMFLEINVPTAHGSSRECSAYLPTDTKKLQKHRGHSEE